MLPAAACAPRAVQIEMRVGEVRALGSFQFTIRKLMPTISDSNRFVNLSVKVLQIE